MRRGWVAPRPKISIRRQCELLGVMRSSVYVTPVGESEQNLELMRHIDACYTATPYYGSRRITLWLNERGHQVNRKRVGRLMRVMGIEAIYPKPKLSKRHPEHRVFPYLLRGVPIERPNQVWCADITYVPLSGGFVYLTAVLDWFSRYVLAWELSNSLDSHFCVEALEGALNGRELPEIFNTDQGVQFTSTAFTDVLLSRGILISMDGRGRVFDNIFIERLWRSTKYEHIYLHDYQCVTALRDGLASYFIMDPEKWTTV